MVVSVVVVAVAVCEPACQLAWRLNEEEGGGEISSSLARLHRRRRRRAASVYLCVSDFPAALA